MNYQLAASLRADDVVDCAFAAPGVQRRAGGRHIQNQEFFRRLLVRERKRADRLDQPLGVLILAADDLRGPEASLIWQNAMEAVAQTREADVAGWLEHNSRIGIILYDVAALDTVYARELEVRIRQRLARRLPSDVVARFSVALHVHSSAPHTPREHDAVACGKPMIGEAIKRLLDILGGAALLLCLAPVLAVIAALVKLKSPGPVLFRQVRIGRNMKPFKMLKFRTMHVNADPALHRAFVSDFITSGSKRQPNDGTAVFKLVADPRITPIGAVLRRTSLDELPQLWNVVTRRDVARRAAPAAAVRSRAVQALARTPGGRSQARHHGICGRSAGAAGRRSTTWCGWICGTRKRSRSGPTSRFSSRRPARSLRAREPVEKELTRAGFERVRVHCA